MILDTLSTFVIYSYIITACFPLCPIPKLLAYSVKITGMMLKNKKQLEKSQQPPEIKLSEVKFRLDAIESRLDRLDPTGITKPAQAAGGTSNYYYKYQKYKHKYLQLKK